MMKGFFCLSVAVLLVFGNICRMSAADELICAIKNKQKFYYPVKQDNDFEAGWHKVTFKYKVEGSKPFSRVFVVVKKDGKTVSYDGIRCFEQFAPHEGLFYVPSPGKIELIVQSGEPGLELTADSGKLVLQDLAFSKVSFGDELLPNAGFKNNEPLNFPGSYDTSYNELAEYKLISDISFKGGTPVLEVNVPEKTAKPDDRPATVRSVNFPLPENGKITVSVWAKGSGMMTVFVLPTDWKGDAGQKTFPITSDWQQYSFTFNIPPHDAAKTYFFRVDFKGKGISCLAGLSLSTAEPQTAGSGKAAADKDRYIGAPGKNLALNPDFELGWMAWHPRYFQPQTINSAVAQLTRPLPFIKSNAGPDGGSAMYMPAGNVIESLCMPIIPGKTYTLSADMKAEKSSSMTMFAVDYAWNMKIKKIDITPQWRRHSFSFKWDGPCYFNEVYMRFDAPQDSGILIDKIQFEENGPSAYEPPKVMLGTIAKLNVFGPGEHADTILRSIPSTQVSGDYKVKVTVTDFNGKVVISRDYNFPAGMTSEAPLDLPTARYGLYIIDLKALDRDNKEIGFGLSRYAVIRKLPDDFQKYYTMGVNYYPYKIPADYYKAELPVWVRMGVGNASAGYDGDLASKNKTLVELCLQEMKFFKQAGCTNSMRVDLSTEVYVKGLILKDDGALPIWRNIVTEAATAYKDAISIYAILSEINIFFVRPGDEAAYRAKGFNVKMPPTGTALMPPDVGMKYFKIGAEAVKAADASLKVAGPSINGEDFAYFKAFMELGAGKYMDFFGMDAYRAGPDTPEAYEDYMKLKKMCKQNGFAGPAINMEQYLGICVKGGLGDHERSRDYYTQWNEELNYAGIIARNYIQHAAANMVWTNFAPEMSLFQPFLLEGGFPSMAGAATGAATYFLNRAGSGVRITQTNDLKAFVFPEAFEGSLMVLYTPLNNVKGTIKISGVRKAYDMMGNEFSQAEIDAGLPVTTGPLYLRFESGTSLDKLKSQFFSSDISGIGDPFTVQLIALGENKLSVRVSNRTNKTLSGKVKLEKLPVEWKLKVREADFENLAGGQQTEQIFTLEQMPVQNLSKYPMAVSVKAGDYYTGKDLTLSPMFADYMSDFKVDGDLDKWKNAKWIDINAKRNLVSSEGDGNDTSARFAIGWNAGGIALAVIVNDKDFMPPSSSPGVMYQRDSIQVYFDQFKDPSGTKTYNNNDVVYQIGLLNNVATAYLEQGPEGRYLGPSNMLQGVDREVKAEIRYIDGRIFYEVFFPYPTTLRFIKPESGYCLGFSLFIHDKSRNGYTEISLDKNSPFKNPSVWKDLVLIKGK